MKYASKETENKFRFENTITSKSNYKINMGFGLEDAKYSNATFQKLANSNGVSEINFTSDLNLLKYSLFGQVSKKYFNSKLGTSFGVRFDGVDYNNEMKNIFNQFSPRMSLSYEIDSKLLLNASAGSYYQLPAYTILGYRDASNELVNKNNNLTPNLLSSPSQKSGVILYILTSMEPGYGK